MKTICTITLLLFVSGNASAQTDKMQAAPQSQMALPPQSAPPGRPLLTFDQLEQMALQHNPTLRQSDAQVHGAQGRERQSALYPNPTVGYQGEQIRGGSFRGGEQGGFIAQTIVLGGKLGAEKKVFAQERLQAQAARDAQTLSVKNAVEIAFYRSLAAQEKVELRENLLELAHDASQTTQQLFNVGEADQPDILQAQVDAEQAQLALESARSQQQSEWQGLAVTVGVPSLAFAPLAGDLEKLPDVNVQQWMQAIVQQNPAAKIARLDVARAQAQLAAAKRQPIPDLQLRAGLEQNQELMGEPARPVGVQGFAEAGVQLPIFNRNQGNIAAARADLERAQAEKQRVELVLRNRAAIIAQQYLTAKSAADQYRNEMIPAATKAYALFSERYQHMAVAYSQVLIAKRRLFQLRAAYVDALENLWSSAVALRGFALTDGLAPPVTAQPLPQPINDLTTPMNGGVMLQP